MAVVGLAASVPVVTMVIGENGAREISFVVAVTLLVTAVVSILIDKNPPERYADYSGYILGYTGRIRQVSADDSLSKQI